MWSRLHLKLIRCLDVVCRYDWVQGRVDTWTHSGCVCGQLSTGEKQRFGQLPGTSNEADFLTTFFDGEKIQEIVQRMGYHNKEGRSQVPLKVYIV